MSEHNDNLGRSFYDELARASLSGKTLEKEIYRKVLMSPDVELLPLLESAYQVRRHHTGNEVEVHIINNIQNGLCPEDCHYCAQARTSQADIEEYPLKSDEEILEEARHAFESGAFRYCMVSSGRGPSPKRARSIAPPSASRAADG